jgi:hypothetical protein
VLARIESIFDPLGLVSPTVIAHKTFLQKLWHDNPLWDEQQHPHCGGTVKNGLGRFSNLDTFESLLIANDLPTTAGNH